MSNKEDFLEALQSLVEVAKVNEKDLTKEEVLQYFSDMELSDEQVEMIFSYLQGKKIQVVEESEKEEQEYSEEDEKYLKIYEEELSYVKPLSEYDREQLFARLARGDSSVKNSIVEDTLSDILNMAKEYVNKGVYIEDLIQEGNLQCIYTLEEMVGAKMVEGHEHLLEEIRKKMIDMVDEELGYEDWESAVVAKTSLLHEATNHLAKELGRVATIHELSQYTKISEEEISDIINLSNEAVKVGTEHETKK